MDRNFVVRQFMQSDGYIVHIPRKVLLSENKNIGGCFYYYYYYYYYFTSVFFLISLGDGGRGDDGNKMVMGMRR